MTAPWDSFEHDPRREEFAHLRASDADRDVINDVLASAYAEGRLTREEFDERTTVVAHSRTLSDLPALVKDLVAPSATPALNELARSTPSGLRAEAERKYRMEKRSAAVRFLIPTLICWAIWISVLINGNGTPFPWPIFVTLGTGARFFQLAFGGEDAIVGIQRSLEKKQARDAQKLEATRLKELGEPAPRPEDPQEN